MFSLRGEINAFLHRKLKVFFNKDKQEYAKGEKNVRKLFFFA